MKQNTKGFTLIELLAVIVILAIIALIATPIILNMINEARKSSAKSSTLGFVDSIEYYAGFSEANATGMKVAGYEMVIPQPASGTTYTCTKSSESGSWTGTVKTGMTNNDTNTTAVSCDTFLGSTGVSGKSKGKAPEKAVVILDANGKVQANSKFYYNKYTCTYDGHDVSSACTSGDSTGA